MAMSWHLPVTWVGAPILTVPWECYRRSKGNQMIAEPQGRFPLDLIKPFKKYGSAVLVQSSRPIEDIIIDSANDTRSTPRCIPKIGPSLAYDCIIAVSILDRITYKVATPLAHIYHGMNRGKTFTRLATSQALK